MTYTSKSIGLRLNSLKNFGDLEFSKRVFEVINKYGVNLLPNLIYEDSSHKLHYNPKDVSNAIELWMNEKKNMQFNNYAEGNIVIEVMYVNYLIIWRKSNRAVFNFLTLSVDKEYFKAQEEFSNFICLCKELTTLIEPVYGEIVNESFLEHNMPINLKCRLPEIGWMVIFGEPYIKMFAKEKLLKTPCCKVESVGNSITLQISKNIFDPIPSTDRDLIKQYLGADAFVESGKPVRAYKTGMTPDFDFSEVLFDKCKPIKEYGIRKMAE